MFLLVRLAKRRAEEILGLAWQEALIRKYMPFFFFLFLGDQAMAIPVQSFFHNATEVPGSPDDIFTTSWPLRAATDLPGILEVLGM